MGCVGVRGRVGYGSVSMRGGGLAQWLGRRISDQGVPGSSLGQAPFVVALSKSHLPPA